MIKDNLFSVIQKKIIIASQIREKKNLKTKFTLSITVSESYIEV